MEKRALLTLTHDQTVEVLRRCTTESCFALAAEFSVSHRTIMRIRDTYKEPSEVPPDAPGATVRKKQINLDFKARKKIIKSLSAGANVEDLAAKYGVSLRTVQRLWQNRDSYMAKISEIKERSGSLGGKRLYSGTPLDEAVIGWYRNELVELGKLVIVSF